MADISFHKEKYLIEGASAKRWIFLSYEMFLTLADNSLSKVEDKKESYKFWCS